MKLEQHEIRAYFEAHLGTLAPSLGKWTKGTCCFHSDNRESMRVNLVTGEWECRTCGNGMIHDIHGFQMRIDQSSDWREADMHINRTIAKRLKEQRSSLESNSFRCIADEDDQLNECSTYVEP
jgi:hypothetical protein